MKNKAKYIFLIVGLVLIVLGAIIPAMFKVERDKLAYYRDMGANDYTCKITITSEKDYNIDSATIYLEDFFGDQELTKAVNSSTISKTKSGKNFVYTFIIEFETFGEYSEFSKVKKVELNTSIGTRIASESSFKWTTPVMIIFIVVGIGLIISSIVMFVNPKLKKNRFEVLEHIEQQINTQQNAIQTEMKPKDKICEYCGSTNSYDAKKCSSCGANLKSKK